MVKCSVILKVMKDVHKKIIMAYFDSDEKLDRKKIAKAAGVSESELIDIYFSPGFQRDFRSGLNYMLMAEVVPRAMQLIKQDLEQPQKAISVSVKLIKDGKYFDHESLDTAAAEENLFRLIKEKGVILDPDLIPDDEIKDFFSDKVFEEIMKKCMKSSKSRK